MTRNTKKQLMVAGVLLFLSSPAFSAKPVQGSGFICTDALGTVRKLNIDLQRRRYDVGEGVRHVAAINDTTIILDAGNPDLLGDNGGLGPILRSLTLDRTSLVLTDQTAMPARGTNRTLSFQCAITEPIDFAEGRKF